MIVITFCSPSCLGQETAKGPFGLRVRCSFAKWSMISEDSGGSAFDKVTKMLDS